MSYLKLYHFIFTAGAMPILKRTAQPSPRPELDMRGEIMKLSAAYSKMHVSKTFPKMSRSRKVENLNPVLPPVPTEKLENLKEDEMVNSTDSVIRVEEFAPAKKSSSEDQEPPEDNVDDNEVSSSEIPSFENAEQIPAMNCPVATSTPKKFNRPEKTQGEKWLSDIEEILTDTEMKCDGKENGDNFLEDGLNAEDQNRFFVSARKSTEMEKIIQRHKQRSPTRSFVEEIIKELNAKCRDPEKAMANYLSSTSANFVKQLVEALERKEDDEKENRPISITAKSSGSGFCSRASCSSNPRFSCSFQKASGLRTKRPSYSYLVPLKDSRGETSYTTCIVEDGTVHWISVPKDESPKKNGQKRGGNCFRSPQDDGQDGWGRTFDRNRKASPKKVRFHDTLVVDSGFWEGSRAVPSVSSLPTGESWYNKDTTCTESETDNVSENGGNLNDAPDTSDRQMQRTTLV